MYNVFSFDNQKNIGDIGETFFCDSFGATRRSGKIIDII